MTWFHRFKATVITFNYDNLIEYVVMTEDIEGLRRQRASTHTPNRHSS